MTNQKEIIIDGVDVSMCNLYRKRTGECKSYRSLYKSCKDNHECHHKIKSQLLRLQAENKKLTEELKKYKEDRFCQGGCVFYQLDTINKLKQALAEIAEISEKAIDICEKCKETEPDEYECVGCPEGAIAGALKGVLQKVKNTLKPE